MKFFAALCLYASVLSADTTRDIVNVAFEYPDPITYKATLLSYLTDPIDLAGELQIFTGITPADAPSTEPFFTLSLCPEITYDFTVGAFNAITIKKSADQSTTCSDPAKQAFVTKIKGVLDNISHATVLRMAYNQRDWVILAFKETPQSKVYEMLVAQKPPSSDGSTSS